SPRTTVNSDKCATTEVEAVGPGLGCVNHAIARTGVLHTFFPQDFVHLDTKLRGRWFVSHGDECEDLVICVLWKALEPEAILYPARVVGVVQFGTTCYLDISTVPTLVDTEVARLFHRCLSKLEPLHRL